MLSRASSLARLQAALVERALGSAHPSLDIESLTRTASGDQDQTSPLWKLPDKGAFTADLSRALLDGDADLAVHSFKDLPVEMPAGTRIAGALPRADARDVVLIKRAAIDQESASLRLLSSSPRRAWLLGDVLPRLLPWRVTGVEAAPVRGNIETRLRKLIEGDAHGLVMAKAALDRVLGFGPPFERDAAVIRGYLDRCRFMVMPMREFPWAPAQGAIAIEIAAARDDLQELMAPILCTATMRAVEGERRVLAEHGGGCHQALGAAIVEKGYGRVVSVRARRCGHRDLGVAGIAAVVSAGRRRSHLARAGHGPVRGPARGGGRATAVPMATGCRAPRRCPATGPISPDTIVWAAGRQTWQRLAARGIWVHGCADGLGDDERPPIDLLAGRALSWIRLTHTGRRHRGRARHLCGRDAAAGRFAVAHALLLDQRRSVHAGGAAVAVDSRRVACIGSRPDPRNDQQRARRQPTRWRVARSRIVGEGHMSVSTPAAQAARWSSLRLRQTAHLRDLCAETSFTTAHLVQPIFIVEGLRALGSHPGAGRQLPARHRWRRSTSSPPTWPRVCGTSCCSPVPTSPAPYGAFAARAVDAIKRRFGQRAVPLGGHLPLLEHRRRPLRDQR